MQIPIAINLLARCCLGFQLYVFDCRILRLCICSFRFLFCVFWDGIRWDSLRKPDVRRWLRVPGFAQRKRKQNKHWVFGPWAHFGGLRNRIITQNERNKTKKCFLGPDADLRICVALKLWLTQPDGWEAVRRYTSNCDLQAVRRRACVCVCVCCNCSCYAISFLLHNPSAACPRHAHLFTE